MQLREGTPADTAACVALFTASVHQLAASHYTLQQRHAWAPLQANMAFWQSHLSGLNLLLAEDARGLLGFIGYANDGHIDMLFCAPDAARSGIASALYAEAEIRLVAFGVTYLYTEASLLAQPFFQRQGFHSLEPEKVQRGDISLLRYRMEKHLY